MQLSSRVLSVSESVTLKLNEKITKMSSSGRHVYNMTAGQLPFKPSPEFIHSLERQLNFLKSYQYSPNAGFEQLREKLIAKTEQKRNVKFPQGEFDCVVSNGSKQSIFNVLGAVIDEGDEVVVLTPYWVSYPEMIKIWGGVASVVNSRTFDNYTPPLEEIEKAINSKTKAIIVNSPNNPAGIHYPDEWMKGFAKIIKKFPELLVISDELYSEISYFDPSPTYFYQHDPELLSQTIIVDGISKTFACTGLRVGHCIGPRNIMEAVSKLQSQTSSAPNSLTQRALIDFDFDLLQHFFDPVKQQLRTCAQIVREKFRDHGMAYSWYQTTSAFYCLLDFSRMPFFENYAIEDSEDKSEHIVQDILEQTGVALVPGAAFGHPNSARMSMTLEVAPFEEAMERLVAFMAVKSS
ncbi:MAG: aminotransferase class I/II-fold pyridoxal phosphate-dependent enzyme [Bacteriovoracaceae bacterium]|nr:aminotransferase class I/II-fold pyridoxal phosphate-dependent enzyme [Bacteriovoracaceae bacterium]